MLLGPAKKGRAEDHVCDVLGVSERRACQVLDQLRSTQRHVRKIPGDEERLVDRVVGLASQCGPYGYRRITALLRKGRLGCEPQEGGADLEAGRAKSAAEAAQTGTIMADGRLLLLEARVVMDDWKKECNQIRPHGSLGNRPPAPEAYVIEISSLGVVH